jgi:hypothetical protein
MASDGRWYPPEARVLAPPPPPPGLYGAAYGPQGPWGAPFASYTPVARTTVNGLAIASLVLGIIWIYWVGSVLALIFGLVAKRQIREAGGQQTGSGFATAGVVLGLVGLGILAIVVIIAFVSHFGSSSSSALGSHLVHLV